MSSNLDILLVGIGGYGRLYVKALLENRDEDIQIKGAVDPAARQSEYYSNLKQIGVPIYASIKDFYQTGGADLAIISSPIQYHCEQSIYALQQGSNVLCEKPAAAVVEDVIKMKKASQESGKFLDIGYQWSHSKAIQNLKKDIKQGLFGRAIKLKTIVLWPRDFDYYHRNNWAGKIKDQQGNLVLDSVANNATAHYLHNMFYVLGKEQDKSIFPESVTAEIYRANDIENYDTAAARILTEDNTELLYYASHAVENTISPSFIFEFEKAKVTYGKFNKDSNQISAFFNDGTVKKYGDPFHNDLRKLWLAIEAAREDLPILCGPEASLSQTISINAMQELFIKEFPDDLIEYTAKKDRIYVEGLDKELLDCFEKAVLPSEKGFSWSQPAKQIQLDSLNIDFAV